MSESDFCEIEFLNLETGEVFLGTDCGRLLSSTEQPRHQVRVSHAVEVSRTCITKAQWNRFAGQDALFNNSTDLNEMADRRSLREISAFITGLNQSEYAAESRVLRLLSEAEWELLANRRESLGIEQLPEGSGEILADIPRANYWGAPCDGRPWLIDSRGRTPNPIRVTRRRHPLSRNRVLRGALNQGSRQAGLGFRIARVEQTEDADSALRLPDGPDRAQILRRELLFFLFIGALPSMLYAAYNAPSYILTGWANLLVGGLVLSLLSGLVWRPRRPSWMIEGDSMVPIPPSRRNPR